MRLKKTITSLLLTVIFASLVLVAFPINSEKLLAYENNSFSAVIRLIVTHPVAEEEDTTPRIASEEKAVPSVYIGEERPEIVVKTLENIYEYNGNSYCANAPIFIENGRTYLGIRDIACSLGIDPLAVKWDDKTKTATISKSGSTLELTEGQTKLKMTYKGYIYYVNTDAPVQIKNDRVYLPFRVIFRQFGYTVNWDSKTRTITCK